MNTIIKMEVPATDVKDWLSIVEQKLEELGFEGQFKELEESILSVVNPTIEAQSIGKVFFEDQILKELAKLHNEYQLGLEETRAN